MQCPVIRLDTYTLLVCKSRVPKRIMLRVTRQRMLKIIAAVFKEV